MTGLNFPPILLLDISARVVGLLLHIFLIVLKITTTVFNLQSENKLPFPVRHLLLVAAADA